MALASSLTLGGGCQKAGNISRVRFPQDSVGTGCVWRDVAHQT